MSVARNANASLVIEPLITFAWIETILEVCIKAWCDIRADEFNFTMEASAKQLIASSALWKYGKLGRGNRRVLPACAVRMFQQAYPSPDGRYMGFSSN